MKKVFASPHKIIRTFFLIAMVLLAGFACTPGGGLNRGNDDLPDEKGAYFDYFTYAGNDSFYNNNPLPDSESFYNPILPGWYSDPSVCSNGEDYFLVTSSFSYFPGVPIFHSRDLVNWEQIGHVLDRPEQLPLDGQRTSEGIFAPAISYNPHNQTYYMITTNIRRGNFFVKTKDPFGSWSDPIWLPDVHGIDPSFFFDDDGRAYIVNNDQPEGPALYEGHRAIWIREFDTETEKTVGEAKMIINGGIKIEEKPIWIEGPHIYKVDGKYLLMDAEGGTGPQHSEVILRSDNPMGPYKPWDKNPILTQRHLDPNRPNPITCAGHADLVQDQKGDWWAVFLACRPIDNEFENLGRETFLMPVKWSEDGFPYMTQGDDLVPMIVKKEGLERTENPTFGNFTITDEFDSEELSPLWMTLRKPADSIISLTGSGYMALEFADVTASETKTPAFLARRMQHHEFEVTSRMVFQPSEEGDAAGLLLYKDETHQYFLALQNTGSGNEIAVIKISESGNEKLAGQQLESNMNDILLKVVSRGKTYDFYYGKDESSMELLLEGVDAHYLSTANSFGFTGTTIGPYATGNLEL